MNLASLQFAKAPLGRIIVVVLALLVVGSCKPRGEPGILTPPIRIGKMLSSSSMYLRGKQIDEVKVQAVYQTQRGYGVLVSLTTVDYPLTYSKTITSKNQRASFTELWHAQSGVGPYSYTVVGFIGLSQAKFNEAAKIGLPLYIEGVYNNKTYGNQTHGSVYGVVPKQAFREVLALQAKGYNY
ncbi:hypothetical protein [Polycladidibacter stylochi]|uniref:hypothetical protein n=1 Tax=Polycladidibacter stylochi TaxID=1807766 RepID=UPI000831FAEB|nr:hypothetical protein [Pseudovibrio stylochi]